VDRSSDSIYVIQSSQTRGSLECQQLGMIKDSIKLINQIESNWEPNWFASEQIYTFIAPFEKIQGWNAKDIEKSNE